MEEMPTDTRLEEIEGQYVLNLLERIEKFVDVPIELLSVVRDSLVDIKNILDVQNQRLAKIDSLSGFEEKVKEAGSFSDSLAVVVSQLEAALNNFRAKTIGIENATKVMENKTVAFKEIVERINYLSASIEQRNNATMALLDEVAKLAALVEEKSSGLGAVVESYSAMRDGMEQGASALGAIQENLRDMRNDIFERNQYLNVIISDLAVSKEAMDRNVQLLESSSLRLRETVEEMNKRTDDILNITMGKVEELKNLRDMLYDDIYQVDQRVKKVQKAVEKQGRAEKKKNKKQTEMANLLKKVSRKIDRMERQMRKTKSKR